MVRMRSWTLMVRSAAMPRVSNHEAVSHAVMISTEFGKFICYDIASFTSCSAVSAKSSSDASP
jgi:hypothetical protein